MTHRVKLSKNHTMNHLEFDILRKDRAYLIKLIPILEGTCCTVTSDRYIFSYYLAFLPFMIVGEYFGDIYLRGSLVFRFLIMDI